MENLKEKLQLLREGFIDSYDILHLESAFLSFNNTQCILTENDSSIAMKNRLNKFAKMVKDMLQAMLTKLIEFGKRIKTFVKTNIEKIKNGDPKKDIVVSYPKKIFETEQDWYNNLLDAMGKINIPGKTRVDMTAAEMRSELISNLFKHKSTQDIYSVDDYVDMMYGEIITEPIAFIDRNKLTNSLNSIDDSINNMKTFINSSTKLLEFHSANIGNMPKSSSKDNAAAIKTQNFNIRLTKEVLIVANRILSAITKKQEILLHISSKIIF